MVTDSDKPEMFSNVPSPKTGVLHKFLFNVILLNSHLPLFLRDETGSEGFTDFPETKPWSQVLPPGLSVRPGASSRPAWAQR